MKITKTKTIPARPERIIEAQPARTEEYMEVVCDACRDRSPCRRFSRRLHSCEICGRDLCGRCRQFDPTNCSDYPGAWCLVCLKLWREKYEAEKVSIENTYDRACEQMKSEWATESLSKAAEAAGGGE